MQLVDGSLVCGGGTGTIVTAPALSDCGRIAPLTENPVWQMEEMPTGPRLMPDMTLLPDGTVFIANGAANGWAGFDNAQTPVLTALLYNPKLPVGQRFQNIAISNIARMYHSETILLEDGRVLILGSAPNADANAINVPYPNERRIEAFYPAYLTSGAQRPTFVITQNDWNYVICKGFVMD